MSNLQTDLGAMQEMASKTQQAFDKLVEMRRYLGQLREARRQLENLHLMTYEEFLREEARRSGHMPDRNSEGTKRQFDEYQDTIERKQDELKAQMERLRTRLTGIVSDLERHVAIILNDMEKSRTHVREVNKAMQNAQRELRLSPQQLNLEHISGIEREVKGLHWLQDQL